MAKYDREEYYTVAALKERGWTPEAIGQLLGRADKLLPNPRVPTGAPRRYYSIERVQAAERSPAWRQWRAQGVEQRSFGYQRRHP